MLRSILDTEKGKCFICERSCKTQEHHIFGGANRKLSTRYGLTVHLCPKCHNEPPEGVHHNIKNMRILQEIGQYAFEDVHGSREYFMQIFGRNYIVEDL